MSFHDDLIFQDQASVVRSQDQWSSGLDIECDHGLRRRCLQFIWESFDFLF